MAEDATSSHPSRYVKLTKDQDAPAEDILPGELNQPVHVPQVRPFTISSSSDLNLIPLSISIPRPARRPEVQRVRPGPARELRAARRRALDYRNLRMHRRPRNL